MNKTRLTTRERYSIISFLICPGHHFMGKRLLFRRMATIVLAITLMCFSSTSCQKAKGPEGKKEVQIHKEEIKEPASLESKSEDQTKPEVKEPIPEKPKGEEKEILLAKEASPLTEEEQRAFEEFGGNWETPGVFKNEKEAIKYLKILLKGSEKTIRWYQKLDMAGKNKEEAEKWKKWKYSDNIATALDAINTETNKEGYKLAVEVLRTKREYPEALAKAALVVKFAHDPSVIPILRVIANYPIPSVRLQVAGSLLSLGDADTALPVLDELAEKEGYTGALYYLFSAPGKIIDERGYTILEKALTNQRAEVRISAIKLLLESKKIEKEKAQETAIAILNKLKNNTLENYGLRLDPKEIYKIIPLSDMKPHEFEKASDLERSDSRACESAMNLSVELKSKKAIAILKYIDSNNSGLSYICRSKNARKALKAIEEVEK